MEEKKNDKREKDYIIDAPLVDEIIKGIDKVNDDGRTEKIIRTLKNENLGKYDPKNISLMNF